MLKRSVTALGLVLSMAIPASALTNDSLPVADVEVTTFLKGLETPDAQAQYPSLNDDLKQAVWDALPNKVTDGGPGYKVDITLTAIRLTDGPTPVNDGRFNLLEGMVEVVNPQLSTVATSFPVLIRAEEGSTGPGTVAVSPSSEAFYSAMLTAFGEATKRELDGVLPDSAVELRD